jgi:hypothetical protein
MVRGKQESAKVYSGQPKFWIGATVAVAEGWDLSGCWLRRLQSSQLVAAGLSAALELFDTIEHRQFV